MDLPEIKSAKIVNSVPGHENTPMKEPELNINAIPNIDELMETVLSVLTYMNTEQMQFMEQADNIGFERHLEEKYSAFHEKHYGIFKLLMDRENRAENVARLIEMFTILHEVKSGKKDLQEADKAYQEELNQKFIYPRFGSREAFEAAVQRAQKDMKKQ